MLRKGALQRIQWSPKCEIAFGAVKWLLCSPMQPRLNKKVYIADQFLGVRPRDGSLPRVWGWITPMLYISRKLLPWEQTYAITEKECLVIKWAVKALHYYLLGAWFHLVTDHALLIRLNTMQEASPQLTKWYLPIQLINFLIHHCPGSAHTNADFFSQDGGWGLKKGEECILGSTLGRGDM